MSKQFVFLFLSVALLMGFASCSKGNKEDVYIPIKSVKATASTSLNERKDWNFYVNKQIYKTTINGRTIHALPKSEKGITYFILQADGSISLSSVGTITSVWILFASPDYHLQRNVYLPEGAAMNELYDQSTLAKMLTMDALSFYHIGLLTSHIDNVKLEHNHCLVDYTFEGLPDGAQTTLLASSVSIRPFVEDGVYKAILQSPNLASVRVEVGDELFEVPLWSYIKQLPMELKATKDVHYNFVVKYDAEEADKDKMLTIQNVITQKWTAAEIAAGKEVF